MQGREPGYVSVYSFPYGHSSNGGIPMVDTLMFDFDLPGDIYTGDGDHAAWSEEIADLLARIRIVVQHLLDEDMAEHWRFSLSGHKGVHMYLDFPEVDTDSGNLTQFKAGLGDYGSELVTYLEDQCHVDLGPWLDVDSSDMGRLTRLPNTQHVSATEAFGSKRYCVPVSATELATMDATDYWVKTAEQRALPDSCRRVESHTAKKRIESYIINSSPGSSSSGQSGSFNYERVKKYKENSNDAFESVEDLWLFIENKPCIREYYNRDDQFHYGNESHVMELFVMSKLVSIGVPYEIIVDFFREMDGFSERQTKQQLNEVIARNYSEFNCEKVWNEAERFCLHQQCDIYNRDH